MIKSGDRLGQEYVDRNAPVVDEQLTKAGLAKMLNTIYDPDGAGVAPAPAAPSKPETKPFVKLSRFHSQWPNRSGPLPGGPSEPDDAGGPLRSDATSGPSLRLLIAPSPASSEPAFGLAETS